MHCAVFSEFLVPLTVIVALPAFSPFIVAVIPFVVFLVDSIVAFSSKLVISIFNSSSASAGSFVAVNSTVCPSSTSYVSVDNSIPVNGVSLGVGVLPPSPPTVTFPHSSISTLYPSILNLKGKLYEASDGKPSHPGISFKFSKSLSLSSSPVLA